MRGRPADHQAPFEGNRVVGEQGLPRAREHHDPLLGVRVGVRERGLVGREALEGEVELVPLRDGDPPEPRRAQGEDLLGMHREDPEVVQHLRQVADRVGHG
jgi:hypothetical protein